MSKVKNGDIILKKDKKILLGDASIQQSSINGLSILDPYNIDLTVVIPTGGSGGGIRIKDGGIEIKGDSNLPFHLAIGNNASLNDDYCLYLDEKFRSTGFILGQAISVENEIDDASTYTVGLYCNVQNNSSVLHHTIAGTWVNANAPANSCVINQIVGGRFGSSVPADNCSITEALGGLFGVGTGYSMSGASFSNMAAGQFQVLDGGSGDVSITNAYGVQIKSPSFNPTGTIDNLYGLYIEDHSNVGFTNDYNFYSAGINSKNKIEGILEVDSIDSTSLIISGDVHCNDLYTSGNTIHVGTGQIKSTSGNIEIYHSGAKILESDSKGIKVNNDIYLYKDDVTGLYLFNLDNGRFRLGGSDGSSNRTILELIPSSTSSPVTFYDKDHPNIISTININGYWIYDGNNNLIGAYSRSGDNLVIEGRRPSGEIHIMGRDSSNNLHSLILANPDGAIELYYTGTKTLETTASGIKISDGSDEATLQFYTGDLQLRSSNYGGTVVLSGYNSSGNFRTMFRGDPDSSTTLFNGGHEAIITRGDGAAFRDSSGNEVRLYQVGTAFGLFSVSPGSVFTVRGYNAAGSITSNLILADPDGSVDLYYANEKKFSTTSNGAEILGDLTINGSLTAQDDDTRITITDDGTNAGYIELIVEGNNIANFDSLSVSINGTVSASSPVNNQNLTTKQYVDDRIGRVRKVYSDSTAIDGDIILVDSTNNITITCIESVDAKIIVKALSIGNVTIQGDSGTIDDQINKILTQPYTFLRCVCDGTDWFVI